MLSIARPSVALSSQARLGPWLWDRAAEWQARLALIGDARERVALSSYYLQWDDYGRACLEAVASARRRRVRVDLLLDAFGQKLGERLMSRPEIGQLDRALDLLRRDGVDLRFFRGRTFRQRRLGFGQHIKIQLCDERAALFSSSNLSRMSYERWSELGVVVEGPLVQLLAATFAGLFDPYAGISVSPYTTQAARPTGEGLVAVDYLADNPCAFPPQAPTGITEVLIERLGRAERQVDLTTFFYKPTPRLHSAVLGAARRGVRVRLFHSAADALGVSEAPWWPAAALYDELLEANVEIYERAEGEHSKVVVVDDRWAMAGSYNFEHAAHERLAEAMLASDAPTFVEPLVAALEGFTRAPAYRRVHAADLSAYSSRRRWGMRLSRPFHRYL